MTGDTGEARGRCGWLTGTNAPSLSSDRLTHRGPENRHLLSQEGAAVREPKQNPNNWTVSRLREDRGSCYVLLCALRPGSEGMWHKASADHAPPGGGVQGHTGERWHVRVVERGRQDAGGRSAGDTGLESPRQCFSN